LYCLCGAYSRLRSSTPHEKHGMLNFVQQSFCPWSTYCKGVTCLPLKGTHDTGRCGQRPSMW